MLRNPNDLKVQASFDVLLHALHPDELTYLEESIATDGIKHELVIWKGKDVVVDGHNRLRIALKQGLETVPCDEQDFADDNAVRAFIYRNQLSRRNVESYLRPVYIARLTEALQPTLGTAQAVRTVASEQNVSERTVYRDLEIVEGLETNEALKTQYLGGNLSATALLAELKRDVVVPKITTKEDREREAQRVFPKTARIVLDRVITGVETLEGLCRDVGIVFKNRGLELARFSEILASPDLSEIKQEAERLKEVNYT